MEQDKAMKNFGPAGFENEPRWFSGLEGPIEEWLTICPCCLKPTQNRWACTACFERLGGADRSRVVFELYRALSSSDCRVTREMRAWFKDIGEKERKGAPAAPLVDDYDYLTITGPRLAALLFRADPVVRSIVQKVSDTQGSISREALDSATVWFDKVWEKARKDADVGCHSTEEQAYRRALDLAAKVIELAKSK